MNINLKNLSVISSGSIVALLSIFFFLRTHNSTNETENRSTTLQRKSIKSAGATKSSVVNPEGTSTKRVQPSRMTPELARKILIDNNEIVNIVERAQKSGEIINVLCLAGFQDEAWLLIEEDQGAVRNKELEAFFSDAKLTQDQFCEKYKTLRPTYEAAAALSCWLEQIDLDQVATMLDFRTSSSQLAKTRATDPELFSGGVCMYIQNQLILNGSDVQERVLKLSSLLLSFGVLEPASVQFIVDKAKFADPFQKWDYINLISNANTARFLERGRSNSISMMVRSDPNRTMGIVKDSNNPIEFQQAVGDLLGADSTQAVNWYTKNAANLNVPMQSAAAFAFFTRALNSGEMDGAEKWAQEIQDPKRKADALKLVSEKLAASATGSK